MIHLINDSEPFTAKWDGIEYELTQEPLEIERGVAEHWMDRYPEAELRIEEILGESIEPRTNMNPLEANDRGEAFAALKPKRRKASEE